MLVLFIFFLILYIEIILPSKIKTLGSDIISMPIDVLFLSPPEIPFTTLPPT